LSVRSGLTLVGAIQLSRVGAIPRSRVGAILLSHVGAGGQFVTVCLNNEALACASARSHRPAWVRIAPTTSVRQDRTDERQADSHRQSSEGSHRHATEGSHRPATPGSHPCISLAPDPI